MPLPATSQHPKAQINTMPTCRIFLKFQERNKIKPKGSWNFSSRTLPTLQNNTAFHGLDEIKQSRMDSKRYAALSQVSQIILKLFQQLLLLVARTTHHIYGTLLADCSWPNPHRKSSREMFDQEQVFLIVCKTHKQRIRKQTTIVCKTLL